MVNDLMPVVAANLRRLRGEQGRSLSELARASGIAKATLSALEAGRGNPTIETLSSLATALGVPFGDLLAGGAPEPVHVVHAAEGTTVPGTANTLRLIVRLPGNPPIELYEARFPARSKRAAGAHGPGTREHVLVTQGALRTGSRRSDGRSARRRLRRLRGRRDAPLRGGTARRARVAHHAVGHPTMTTFEGRTALVTGASGGIGRRIAERLAAAGATVALHYSSNAEPAQELASALPRAAAFGADLGEPDAPDRLVDEVESVFGPVDVLVANHGRSQVARLEQVDADAFDEMLAVNLRAPFLLARRTIPGMSEHGFGRVLFMSSVAGLTGGIVGPHYAASKAGLHGLTHYLARRSAGEGVTVNALAPALIEDTGMLPGDPGALATMIPVGRLGRPEEVADLALAILRNGYMTNQVVSLDGGMHPR